MEAINPKYTKKIQDLYRLERQHENLVDEHQAIREDQEIEEEDRRAMGSGGSGSDYDNVMGINRLSLLQ